MKHPASAYQPRPVSDRRFRQISKLKDAMEKSTLPGQQADFDELELQLQKTAAAGKAAAEKDLDVLKKMISRQQEIVGAVPDRRTEGFIRFVLEEFAEDLEQYPTEAEVFKVAGLCRVVEALILSSTLLTVPVRPGGK